MELCDENQKHAGDTCPLVYQCRLPLSTRTVNHLADLLRRHLKVIRSRWRILPPGKIAVIVLAVLRHDQRLADMAGGNDVSESTVRRWRDELVTLLAAQAPRLDRALKKVARQGGEVVLIDGTLIHTRSAARRSGHPSSTTHRARRSLPVGVSGALRWDTRASWTSVQTSQSTPNPEGPHPFKHPARVSPTSRTTQLGSFVWISRSLVRLCR
ncbi:hypothetical protein SGLAM104S_02807 [Streptomyces glaucescens]